MRRYVSPVAKIPANSPIGTANPKIVAAFKGEAMPTIEELMAMEAGPGDGRALALH